ncbi:Holliday junction DNA helicase, RuvA subunit [Thiovulum sp. ES]|nr:Holliday junction DNA helicase, RuvA subunit [Thiovulum sp. ES]
MIVGLEGVVRSVFPNSLQVNVNGLIYEVFTSIFDSDEVEENQKIYLYVHQIIRENSIELFGFLQKSREDIFKELIKISGVGGKVALAILSTLSESELLRIIETGDEKSLTKVPKIGLKSAKKILTELTFMKEKLNLSGSSENSEKNLALDALLELGFARNNILKAVENLSGTHQQIIKDALKTLSR